MRIKLLLPLLFTVLPLAAQPDGSEGTPFRDRFTVGGRVRLFPLDLFDDTTLTRTFTNPAAELTYKTKPTSPLAGLGPSVEFFFTPRISVAADFLYHRARYEATTEARHGVDDPSTTDNDERELTTVEETTRAEYWDIPVLFRLHQFRRTGLASKFVVSAGVAYRRIQSIRSFTQITHDDDSTSTDETQASPRKRGLVGGVIGVGFQFVDDFGIRFTPEIRYTHWAGRTFDNASTRARQGQIEVLIGLTF